MVCIFCNYFSSYIFSSFYHDDLDRVGLFGGLLLLNIDEQYLLSNFAQMGIFHDLAHLFDLRFLSNGRTDLVTNHTSGGLELLDNLSALGESQDWYRRSVLGYKPGKSASLSVADDKVDWQVQDCVHGRCSNSLGS